MLGEQQQEQLQQSNCNKGIFKVKTAYMKAFQNLHQNLHSLTQLKEPYYPECRSCSTASLAELQNFHCCPKPVAMYLSHSCLSDSGLTILKLIMCSAPPTVAACIVGYNAISTRIFSFCDCIVNKIASPCKVHLLLLIQKPLRHICHVCVGKLPVIFVLLMVKEVSSGKASTLPQLAGSTPACILHMSTLYACTDGVTT